MPDSANNRNKLYEQVATLYGRALRRLAHAYEADPDRQQDLLQEIQLEVWKSLAVYESRCALRTWVYRVAHNTAAKHVVRRMRAKAEVFVRIEDLPKISERVHAQTDSPEVMNELMDLIRSLKPPDRQLMLLYLEDLDAESIAEVMGLSPANVRTKVHRLKATLQRRFHQGAHR